MAARISFTRLARLASETNVSGQRRAKSSSFANGFGRAASSISRSWKALPERRTGLPPRSSVRDSASKRQSPKRTRIPELSQNSLRSPSSLSHGASPSYAQEVVHEETTHSSRAWAPRPRHAGLRSQEARRRYHAR